MKSNNNGGNRAYMYTSHHQIKPPVPGMVYNYSSCWSNGSHGSPQINTAIARALCCSLKAACKALLLKPTPTQLIEHGKVKVVPT